MTKNFNQFKYLSSNKQLPLIIGLSGEERWLIFNALNIIRKYNEIKLVDFNFHNFDATNVTIDDILISANTLPIISNIRLIEVYNADNIKKSDVEKLESYIKNLNICTFLVFIFESKIISNTTIMPYLDSKKFLFYFKKVKEYEMKKITLDMVKIKKLTITNDAISALLLIVNRNLIMLDNILSKLQIVKKCSKITSIDILKHVPDFYIQDTFELAIAIASCDVNRTFSIIYKLRLSNSIPSKIVPIIAWQLRVILKAKIMLDEDCIPILIAEKLSLFGANKKNVFDIANRFSLNVHIKRLTTLNIFYSNFYKYSKNISWLLFEYRVLELC